MAEEISTERGGGSSTPFLVGYLGTLLMFFTVVVFIVALSSCAGDDTGPADVRRSQTANYDSSWHVITIPGTDLQCVVSDYREGVWCR